MTGGDYGFTIMMKTLASGSTVAIEPNTYQRRASRQYWSGTVASCSNRRARRVWRT